jgi:hypothetical protein
MHYLFEIIDPYSLNKQGVDKGPKYRTGVYSIFIIKSLRRSIRTSCFSSHNTWQCFNKCLYTPQKYDGYVECVKTVFNPDITSIHDLMHYLFEIIDPYCVVPFARPASVAITPGNVLINACTPHKHPPARYKHLLKHCQVLWLLKQDVRMERRSDLMMNMMAM